MLAVRTHHLLVADDNPDLLAAYVQYFQIHGYEVRATHDGTDALTEYCRWLPAIVILDVQMPGLDGRTVAREIRRLRGLTVPLVVAVSGLSSAAEMAESLKSGFDYHFAKPVELPAILAVIAARSRISDPAIAHARRFD